MGRFHHAAMVSSHYATILDMSVRRRHVMDHWFYGVFFVLPRFRREFRRTGFAWLVCFVVHEWTGRGVMASLLLNENDAVAELTVNPQGSPPRRRKHR